MSGRVRHRVTETLEPDAPEPIEAVEHAEAARQAAGVTDALAGLDEFTEAGASFKVYKLPGYQYCQEIDPRDDTTSILEDVRDQYGPGNYVVRVYVKGRKGQLTERPFSIAAPRRREDKPPAGQTFAEQMLLAMVSGGGLGGKGNGDLAAILAAQQASADRQLTAMTTMFATIVPAIAGGGKGGDSAAELLTAIGPLIERPKAPGFGEAIEWLSSAKELFSGGGGGGEDDGVVGAVVKAIAPSVPEFAKGFADMAATARQNGAQPVHTVPPGRMAIVAPEAAPGPSTGPLAQFPLLAAIAPDVRFYFGRGLPPELAADCVFETLNRMRVGELDLAPIIAAFSASQDWIADLAAGGLDLTSNPAWASQFLAELVALYRGEDDDSERRGGGEGDIAGNGPPGEGG